MPELFRRVLKVQVHDLEITTLDMAFEVDKSLSPKTPNSAEVRIWNLNGAHRKQLQELEKVFCSIEVGYASGTFVLFRGDLRDVISTRDSATDWVTTITSDSGRRARKRRILKSFAPGASVGDVLRAAAAGMGVKLGNTALKTVTAKIRGTGADKFFNGYTLAGAIVDEIDRLARSTGLEWSIQDDELQFLDRGAPLQQMGVVLTDSTGLVGSPEPGNKGVMEVRALLMPGLEPGRRVQVASTHIKGVFRIETAKCHGGTAEKDWYADLQLASEERKKA